MEEYKFKIKTSVACLEAVFLGFLYTIFFIDVEWVQNIPLNSHLKIILVFLLVSTTWFLLARRASIVIDKNGLHSKGVNFFSGFTGGGSFREIIWQQYNLIEIDKTKPSKSIWYIGTQENTLHFLNTEKNKITHRLNLNLYTNINREKFEVIYKSLILDIKVVTEDDYARNFDPNTIDLGKRAGYLAYSSLGLVVIMAIIAYVDDYKTIDFGYIGYVALLVGLVIAFLCWRFLTTKDDMIEENWLVVFLFSSIFACTSMFAFMAVSTKFASKEVQTFEYKKVNNSNEATWENKQTEQTFWCRVPSDFNKSTKRIEVLRFMSITRVHISKACPKT